MAEKKSKVKESSGELAFTKETVDILVANVIPTTKYFETRFNAMEERMNHMAIDTQRQFEYMANDMNRRFEQVDRRFEQMDKRFEQVDRRFEQVANDMSQRFEQVDKQFEKMEIEIHQLKDNMSKLTEKVSELTTEVKTSVRDYIIERDRYYDRKFNQLRMFIIALLVGVGGLFLKVAGFFEKLFR